MSGLALLALVVRWPNLWLVPRFTDETLEVLHSLAIVRDGARPLTNYDSYYGALYNYLVALALLVSGESPLAPRVVVLLAGVATVVATYLLGAELGRRIAPRPDGTRDPIGAAPRRAAGGRPARHQRPARRRQQPRRLVELPDAAADDAGVLGAAAVADRLTARPPLPRAGRDAASPDSRLAARSRRERGWGVGSCSLAGLLLGLALQTHPLVVAHPARASRWRVLLRDWRILKTPWPWLAALAFLVGYANVLRLQRRAGLRVAAQRPAHPGRVRPGPAGRLRATLPTAALDAAPARPHRRRRRRPARERRRRTSPIPACSSSPGWRSPASACWRPAASRCRCWSACSFLLILPAANPKFQTLLTTRYLMPIVPLLFACAGPDAGLAGRAGASPLARRAPPTAARRAAGRPGAGRAADDLARPLLPPRVRAHRHQRAHPEARRRGRGRPPARRDAS